MEVSLEPAASDPLDVDREPGVQREDVVVVGQEGVRRALRIQTGLDEVGSADNCRGSIDVDVALVEQTEPEFLQQQPPHRDVDSVLGYAAGRNPTPDTPDELCQGIAVPARQSAWRPVPVAPAIARQPRH